VEREALGILLGSPGQLAEGLSLITADHFTQPEHRVLFDAIAGASREGNGSSVMARLPDDDSRRLAAELALAPTITKDPEEVFLRLEEFRIGRQIDHLKAKLDGLDPKTDPETYDALFEELMRLNIERRRFDDK
jgi:DNA primase